MNTLEDAVLEVYRTALVANHQNARAGADPRKSPEFRLLRALEEAHPAIVLKSRP